MITLIPYEENNIDLQLELLADLTNDPNPDRFDGVPPVYEPEKIMVASLGSIRGLLVQSVVGQTTEEQKIYYFINDHLGTPQKLLNESADVVWSADYKPFGEADVDINTFANNFRFPGQYFDQETGLHYNYHRYYDHAIGRYLRADPIGLAGGISLFLYATNNPINAIDPLGLRVSIVYRPLKGLAYGLGYHQAISINGVIYGFSKDVGVVKESSSDYGWGSHEKVIYPGDEHDKAVLDYLKNAAADNDPRFTKDTYGLCTNNCMTFVDTALEEAVQKEESKCQ